MLVLLSHKDFGAYIAGIWQWCVSMSGLSLSACILFAQDNSVYAHCPSRSSSFTPKSIPAWVINSLIHLAEVVCSLWGCSKGQRKTCYLLVCHFHSFSFCTWYSLWDFSSPTQVRTQKNQPGSETTESQPLGYQGSPYLCFLIPVS